MNNHEHVQHLVEHSIGIGIQLTLFLPFVLMTSVYIVAVIHSNRTYRRWPLIRTICLLVGMICASLAVIGPLADRAHTDFYVHMFAHLLLGMAAPLFIVLSAPMTLLLRTVSVKIARKITKILKKEIIRFLSDPLFTSIMNIGGLWIVYMTDLFGVMHENSGVFIAIHVHMFLAGYFFTYSMIHIDPNPHRANFLYRSIVLVLAISGHGVLAKYLYANPPIGVAITMAEEGAKLMYYGGDLIDIVIIFIICLQWYKQSRPRMIAQQ